MAVIADLDLLVNGFDHIDPDAELKTARDNLLARVDELVVPAAHGPSTAEAQDAHDWAELQALWRRVRERQAQLRAGDCTQDEHDQAVEAFFAWQRRSDRLAVLRTEDRRKASPIEMAVAADATCRRCLRARTRCHRTVFPETITGADSHGGAKTSVTRSRHVKRFSVVARNRNMTGEVFG